MDSDLYNLVLEDIGDRQSWADKQESWYRMRGPGIRRSKLPWPGASNLNYPLADGIIDKQKPFYLQQLYANERFADFTGKPGAEDQLIQAASYWFDYKLRVKSNIEEEMAFLNDDLLVFGRGIMKCTWDVGNKRLRHESIEPIYIIVPSDTVTLGTADRVTHVRHLTPYQYKYGPDSKNFKKDADFVKGITGRPYDEKTDSTAQAARIARGITHSEERTIIIWEVYEKIEGDKWMVHTISPMRYQEDVRPPFELPYKLYGKHPFVEFTFEDRRGYYECRGICELLQDMQMSMNKMWNEKHDCMTLFNRPVFAADHDIPNTANIKLQPGSILPFKVSAMNMGSPPISFDQEMSNTRFVAEQRVSVPDFGTNNPARKGDNKTATEVDAIMGQQQMSVDMRARSYRRNLSHLLCIDWYLLKQYDKDLLYIKDDKEYEMDEDSLDLIESIEPSGSADSWNTPKRMQKAIQRKMLFAQSPNISQGELDKSILELDEPGLVKRLYIDPMQQQKDQAQRQMIEIPALESGLPIAPSADDDDAVHLNVLYQRAVEKAQQGAKAPPQAQQAHAQHIGLHLQRLQAKDNNTAKAIAKQFEELGKALQQGPPQQ
jgi:hypothetical protein